MKQYISTLSGSKGHLRGGPCCFRPRALAGLLPLLLVAVAAACGTRGDSPASARAEPFARPLDIYRDLGFLTGTGQFPVVASFSTVAGPADSTLVLMGLSMPNSALRFQRAGAGFQAEYDVSISFLTPDSVPVTRHSSRETVRIPTFAETSRTDESVVFQHAFVLSPGSYIVRVQASDANSSRGFRMTDTLSAPVYGREGARVATPILTYRADGRHDRAAAPRIILNPRHTVPYGGEAPVLYVEAYGDVAPLVAEVVDAQGAPVWQGPVTLQGDSGDVRFGVVTIPSQDFPLGRFWVRVAGPAAPPPPRPLLLAISDQWMVANFEDVLQIMRYIAHPEELDSLRVDAPVQRREQWDRFWDRRDPLRATGVNEFRDAFFQRVRFATEAFREPGLAGWQTHRGEVYIVLGPPEHAMERHIGRPDVTGRPNALEWLYPNAAGSRLNLLFHDRSGVGRLELVPSSASAFRAAAERLKPRRDRN